jgi:hypothetical protein
MFQSSGRFRLVAVIVLMLFSLTAVAPMAAAQGKGGNSEAAHACQKGGFAHLKRADGTRFANTGECVSFAAQGGELLPLAPDVVVSFDPTGDPFYCLVQVDLVDFDPNTTYPVDVQIIGGLLYNAELTTDETGFASGYPIGSFYNQNRFVQVTSNGITTDIIPITCAP